MVFKNNTLTQVTAPSQTGPFFIRDSMVDEFSNSSFSQGRSEGVQQTHLELQSSQVRMDGCNFTGSD